VYWVKVCVEDAGVVDQRIDAAEPGPSFSDHALGGPGLALSGTLSTLSSFDGDRRAVATPGNCGRDRP
jgi:hypothetical protein